MKSGEKIFFKSEKRPYTVKAFDGRYAICTKPFNLKRTVIYCIVDFKEKIRSSNDFLFNPYDYEDKKGIVQCLKDLQKGKCRLSQRNAITLDIAN